MYLCMYACMYIGVKLLLEHGANVSLPNKGVRHGHMCMYVLGYECMRAHGWVCGFMRLQMRACVCESMSST